VDFISTLGGNGSGDRFVILGGFYLPNFPSSEKFPVLTKEGKVPQFSLLAKTRYFDRLVGGCCLFHLAEDLAFG